MTHVNTSTRSGELGIDEGLRSHMSRVYKEMSYALLITAAISYIFGNDLRTALSGSAETLLPHGLITMLYQGPMIWVVIFAPIAITLLTAPFLSRMSSAAAGWILFAFATSFGLSLATIFVRFTDIMIAQSFLSTAIAFAALSLFGYTTKRDISGWGSFLIIGVVGLLVVSILNIFLQSDGLSFAVSLLGVLIFAGLTAFDTQMIKNEYLAARNHLPEDQLAKLATLGALNLYIDFIAMFQHLLNLLPHGE